MTTVNEAASNQKPQLAAELAAGLDLLSGRQQITFTLYKKMVLPLDGFVFWINSNLLTDPNLPSATQIVQGSLHYTTEMQQEEASTISLNTIVFTAKTPCDLFQEIDPQYLYLANYNDIRFSFSSQGKYYQQADLWHYLGIAVTSVMNTQIVDDINVLNSLADKLVITNSLPIWLSMIDYVTAGVGFTCPIQSLYPSFLVPENEPPPYASVHIEETKALEAYPLIDSRYASSQLVSDVVKVTTYGVDNYDIITFLNFVIQFTLDTALIGLMNMPSINDVKQEQSEMQVIAQKKEIEFKVSYLQKFMPDIHLTRQLIRHAHVDIDVWTETNKKRAHVAPEKPCIQGATAPLP